MGLRSEESIAALCRHERIAESLYYKWSREFLEAGKRQLSGDAARQATAPEVKELRSEASALKECMADLTLENRLLKKSMVRDGEFEQKDMPGIPRTTFYRWYDLYLEDGLDGLSDKPSRPGSWARHQNPFLSTEA